MVSAARAIVLSLKPFQPPPLPSHHHQFLFLSPRHVIPPITIALSSRRRIVGCLVSGGGLSDTRKSEFSRGFAVIATMLKRIEPLDSSDISKGVSDSAKDSMKQTISTMLGLLPSDQFDVSIRVSKLPLHRLLVSSIITGYTLWNAEYRMSLVRNFDLSLDKSETHNSEGKNEVLGLSAEERELGSGEACVDDGLDSSEQISSHSLKNLSPEALQYIQQLEAELSSVEKGLNQPELVDNGKTNRNECNFPVGQKISRKEKINFLIKTLLNLDNNKDAVYGTLDAWVAWEQKFPIAALKNVILALEKEQQWHRVVQVIKWMLSKGQGNTLGTYQQLIRALDMDHRAEEAHNFWTKKIGNDLHSVPWQTCRLMISVYYRNDMLDRLVKLFKGLEAFDRRPPEKSLVQKVADAYEILGMMDDKGRILQKYADLLSKRRRESSKKSKIVKSKKKDTL